MEAKNNIVEDYTPVLEQNFGKVGSAEWEKSIEEAEAFYTGQIIEETRRARCSENDTKRTRCETKRH